MTPKTYVGNELGCGKVIPKMCRINISLGAVRICLDDRYGMDKEVLKKIISFSASNDSSILLIIDRQNGFITNACNIRGATFSGKDLNIVDPCFIYRIDLGLENLCDIAKAKFHAVIYLPLKTARCWESFREYFCIVLAHEITHANIIHANTELHRGLVWLSEHTGEILERSDRNVGVERNWDVPIERYCNICGKKTASSIFGESDVLECLQRLIPQESEKHGEYIQHLIDVDAAENFTSEMLIEKTRTYYLGTEKITHEIWEQKKEDGDALSLAFDLNRILD